MSDTRAQTDLPHRSISRRALALSDGVSLLITTVAGLICYGLFYNRGLGLSVIGYSIAPAERLMQGEVPYRDFLFNYTPGILWVNAFLMKAFGPTLMATRIGLFVFKLCSLILLYHIGKRLTNRWSALLPVVMTLSWLGYGQVFNVYPDQYLIPIALTGLLFMFNYDETGKARWLVWCGLATGFVLLFKHNVGVLLLAAGLVVVMTRELLTRVRRAPSLRAASIYLAAFAAVVAALAVYLIYTHSLVAMISHFLHHAAEYSETRSVTLPPPTTLMPVAFLLVPATLFLLLIMLIWSRAFELLLFVTVLAGSITLFTAQRGDVPNDAMLASIAYLPPILFLISALLMGWQIRKYRSDLPSWWTRNGKLVTTGLFALALYLEVFPRADYYHLVRVLPPVFLFLVALLYAYLDSLTQNLRKLVDSPRRTAWLVVLAPIVFAIAIGLNNTWATEFDSRFQFKDSRQLQVERGRGIFVEEKQADLTEGLVELIQSNSSADDYIFSFAQRGSALYFLAARKNPTRFLWWRSVGISGDERDAVMTMIANRRAKLIVVQDVAANKEIQDFILENYDPVGTVADIAVYGLRPVRAQVSETVRSSSTGDLPRTSRFGLRSPQRF